MVFYFSATGNSKYVAKKISDVFNSELVNISIAHNNRDYEYNVKDEELVFFVFPVYFYGMPNIVEEFIANLNFISGKPKICAIATCGSNPGASDRFFNEAFKEKNIDKTYFYKVKMVDNYVFMFNVPLKEVQTLVLRKADKEINDIIDAINFNFRASYKSSIFTNYFSKLAHYFYHGKCSTTKFWTDGKCNSCGLCEEVCPVNAIKIIEGKPNWIKKDCVHCTGCINKCPMEAIQYGKSTVKRRRYVNPEVE